jgi:protein involved in polysaccharide export with SLBB domain
MLIKEFNSQRVTIEGAVKKPGVYPLRGQTTLLQVVVSALGPRDEVLAKCSRSPPRATTAGKAPFSIVQ